MTFFRSIVPCFVVLAMVSAEVSVADDSSEAPEVRMDVLPQAEWDAIDAAVDRGLEYITANQQPDGSFPAPRSSQPGVTSLGVMALLSRGHLPGEGPHGEAINKAITYALSAQQDSGVYAWSEMNDGGDYNQSVLYNHAICGLMLSEVFGMSGVEDADGLRKSIERGIEYSRNTQTSPKRLPLDEGGWRYPQAWGPNDSDLTATCWNLTFYRSARNAGFEIPEEFVNEAVEFVRRCFDPEQRAFVYALQQGRDRERYVSGGSAAGGIIALAMAGEHGSDMVQQSAEWIHAHNFDRYNRREYFEDRYHYSAFYCSQAMYQLGGANWEKFYPRFRRVMLKNQNNDGSWDPEVHRYDREIGDVYTTSLSVLALTAPYQMLPIYQR